MLSLISQHVAERQCVEQFSSRHVCQVRCCFKIQRHDKCSTGCLLGMLSMARQLAMAMARTCYGRIILGTTATASQAKVKVEEDLQETQDGSKSEIDAFLASLRACTQNKDLVTGTRIHERKKKLLNVDMSSSNVVTWTALIAGYAREAHGQNALDCFE